MKSFCLFLIAVLTVSCAGRCDRPVESDAKVFKVNFKRDNKSDKIRMSDIFESVTYVHLDDADGEACIGEVSRIRVTDAGIFVSDRLSQAVYMFDSLGRFIRRYKHHGRGPQEYVVLSGFDVCGKNGNISVYDGARNCMCVYSSDDRFLYEFRINDIPRDFAVLDNGDYLFYTPDYMRGVNRGLWQTDSLGVLKKQLVVISDDFKFYSGIHEQYFQHMGDKVIVSVPDEKDALYRIDADTIHTAYELKMDIDIPKYVKRSPVAELANHKGEVYTIYNYFETNDWMTVTATDLLKTIILFYDKSADKQYFVSTDEDIIQDMPHIGLICAATDESLIGLLSVEHILSYKSLQDMFPSVSENSNPVLSICRTK